MTGSMDGPLTETQFAETCLCVDATWVLSVGGPIPPIGVAVEKPEFDVELPFGAPLLIFP